MVPKQIRIIVAGGRDFTPEYGVEPLKRLLANVPVEDLGEVELVSGTASGADQIPYLFSFPIKEFPPNWDKHGKSAGYKRNREMAFYATHLVAFWDGESKGTKHMIDLAYKYNLTVKVIKYKMAEIEQEED